MSNIQDVLGWAVLNGHLVTEYACGETLDSFVVLENGVPAADQSGKPTQAQLDGWSAQYNTRDISVEEFDQFMISPDLTRRVLKKLILSLNDGSFAPGQSLTNAQLKNVLKS